METDLPTAGHGGRPSEHPERHDRRNTAAARSASRTRRP